MARRGTRAAGRGTSYEQPGRSSESARKKAAKKGPSTEGTPKKRRRYPRLSGVLIVFGALLMVVSGGLLIGVRTVIAQAEGSLQVEDLFGDSGAAGPKGEVPDGALNILMVGLDARPGASAAQSRADTVIVLHIPASRDRAFLISIPRDLLVTAKAFPKSGYGGGRAKLTETFFHGAQKTAGVSGGMELLAGTIKNTPELGLTFNAAAIINFESFTKVVDQLGGVDLCIDQDVQSKHIYVDASGNPTNIEGEPNPSRFGKPATYKKGECRRFKPWEALDFSRQRYGLKNGDYDRQRHQLQLMKAIVKEATGKQVLTSPSKLDSVLKSAGSAFVVDTRGVAVADFVLALGGIAGSDLLTVRTNAGKVNSQQIDGVSYEALTPDSVQMFQALRDGNLIEFLAQHPDFNGS